MSKQVPEPSQLCCAVRVKGLDAIGIAGPHDMNESCLRSRTINPSLKTTVSQDPVPKTCDGWDKTWGEATEGLEIKQKRNHASPTFLAEIVQDIKVREAQEILTIYAECMQTCPCLKVTPSHPS